MARFSLSTVLSMLDIPMPEDDNMSDDDFDDVMTVTLGRMTLLKMAPVKQQVTA